MSTLRKHISLGLSPLQVVQDSLILALNFTRTQDVINRRFKERIKILHLEFQQMIAYSKVRNKELDVMHDRITNMETALKAFTQKFQIQTASIDRALQEITKKSRQIQILRRDLHISRDFTQNQIAKNCKFESRLHYLETKGPPDLVQLEEQVCTLNEQVEALNREKLYLYQKLEPLLSQLD